MSSRTVAILNWICLIIMLTLNGMANGLPLNGYSTGEISALYPNLFVPAGFTFSIWGLIYLLLIGFVIYATVQLWNEKRGIATQNIRKISPMFQVSSLLNAGWIVAWHYLQTTLSVMIMLLLLLTLILTYLRLQPAYRSMDRAQQLFVYTPFIIYLGWISVATIANITAWLVFIRWDGFGVEPDTWTKTMIIIAGMLGAIFAWSKKDIPYTLVIIWALFGIHAANEQRSETSVLTPVIVMGVLALQIVYVLAGKAKRKQ